MQFKLEGRKTICLFIYCKNLPEAIKFQENLGGFIIDGLEA
jgi:hypothetical protein